MPVSSVKYLLNMLPNQTQIKLERAAVAHCSPENTTFIISTVAAMRIRWRVGLSPFLEQLQKAFVPHLD